MADFRRRPRRKWAVAVTIVLGAALLVAAVWTDVQERTRARHEEAALAAAGAHLASLRHDVAVTRFATAVTTGKRNALQASIAVTLSQLASTNEVLAATNVHAFLQGASIDTLQTCLGGVQNALGQISAHDTTQAAKDISSVSGPCSALDGGTSAGLVYPFDFPDPDVILVGQTYFAYATNSVAGNIQIIESTDLTHWTAVGNALPSLPTWAQAQYTWAPAVAFIGGTFVLYYAANVAGSGRECISVATASQPQGPFVDRSTAPLECQPALGGSIDPASFIDANGNLYLLWKSGGPGTSKIWSEQLSPGGTAFAAGATPTTLLVPTQEWEAGTVEAPDMVTVAGRYFLFFSGNDWETADYGVGVATCSGPLGPCNDSSPTPILSSGRGVAGPGGESVFADTTGAYWIAFHAWVPGAVGFPNSRDLYLRRLTVSGPTPVVAATG
ncbi:MAG: glycoside hydrolase family 43 protein [Acidimicrobiales bacterium]